MEDQELLWGLLFAKYPIEYDTLDKSIRRWDSIKSRYGDYDDISDEFKEKTNSQRKVYLEEIIKTLESVSLSNIETLVIRLGSYALSITFPFGKTPFNKTMNWLQDIYATVEDMYNYYGCIKHLYEKEILKIPENNHKILSQYGNIISQINWKKEPEEFDRQIQALEAAGYIKIIDCFITFIHNDAYEDVIALYIYWFETKCIIPKQRNQKDTIPQTIIARNFKRLENNKSTAYNPSQIGTIKDNLTPEEIETRVEYFRKLLK